MLSVTVTTSGAVRDYVEYERDDSLYYGAVLVFGMLCFGKELKIDKENRSSLIRDEDFLVIVSVPNERWKRQRGPILCVSAMDWWARCLELLRRGQRDVEGRK